MLAALPQLVHAPLGGPHALLAAARHVRAGQQEHVLEGIAGLAHEATYGAIGPVALVGVDTAAERDQLADTVDRCPVELQAVQDLSRHALAHDLVAVEMHLIVLDGHDARLGDVVQHGAPAHREHRRRAVEHHQRVLEVVLVANVRVVGPEGQELGNDVPHEAEIGQLSNRPARPRPDQDPVQLLADALGADRLQAVRVACDGLPGVGLDLETELRCKAYAPQQAQRVLPEPLIGVAHRPDRASSQVGSTAKRIDDLAARGWLGHRVDGEVAAGEVRLQAGAERHLGLAAAGRVRLGAVGRDLEAVVAEERADRAEPLADRIDGVCVRDVQQALDGIRFGVGREVVVVDGNAEQLVAHGAADEVEAAPILGKSARQPFNGMHLGGRHAGF